MVAGGGKISRDEGRPRWTSWLAAQTHSRLFRTPSTFSPVTLNTRAYNILPCRQSTERAWDDVVEIQICSWFSQATVLASTTIADEDVLPTEPNVSPRNPVERHEQDHSRDANQSGYHTHALACGRGNL
jgi:hypothetical protein